jgi:DNA-binding response OmpR family regulator
VNAETSPDARARLSILIAEDERDTATTLATILMHEGHVVHCVYRGDHVAEAVRRYKPDVCILDIDLPGRSGYELAEDLYAMTTRRRPILVAVSGKYVKKSEQLLAEAVGFDRFFVKPAEPSELIAFLDKAASGRK